MNETAVLTLVLAGLAGGVIGLFFSGVSGGRFVKVFRFNSRLSGSSAVWCCECASL